MYRLGASYPKTHPTSFKETHVRTRIMALLMAGVVAGCAKDNSTGPATNGGHVSLQLATVGTGALATASDPAGVTITKGSDVIVISRVQMVARRLKIKQVNGTCPNPDMSDDGDHDRDDTPECPNLKLGPLLLDPPIGPGTQTSFSADIPVGQYREIELQIHKPTRAKSDSAFVAAHPDFANASIKVTGTFNQTAFTFTTGLTASEEIEFDQPLTVTATGTTSLTLLLDVSGWFFDREGDALLSPVSPISDQTQVRIARSIRQSFRAFKDQDHDGRKDN